MFPTQGDNARETGFIGIGASRPHGPGVSFWSLRTHCARVPFRSLRTHRARVAFRPLRTERACVPFCPLRPSRTDRTLRSLGSFFTRRAATAFDQFLKQLRARHELPHAVV